VREEGGKGVRERERKEREAESGGNVDEGRGMEFRRKGGRSGGE